MSAKFMLENPSPPPSPPPDDFNISDPIPSTSQGLCDGKTVLPVSAAVKAELDHGEEAISESSGAKRKTKIGIKKELDPEEASIKQQIAASSGFENDFYCKNCQLHTNSEYTYRMHLSGKKHQKKMQLLACVSDSPEPVTIPPKGNIREIRVGGKKCVVPTRTKKNATPKIQRVLDECDVPLIGLEYVTELQPSNEYDELSYHCTLCPADCHVNSIVDHLIGFKHRFTCIKMKDPDLYAELSASALSKSEISEIVTAHAETFEEKYGRKRLIVEVIDPGESDEETEGSDDDEEDLPLPPISDYTEEELKAAEEEIQALKPKDLLEYMKNLTTDIFQEECALDKVTRSEADECENTTYANMLKAFNELKFNSTSPRNIENIFRQLMAGNSAPYREFYGVPASTCGVIMRPVVERMIQEGKIVWDENNEQ